MGEKRIESRKEKSKVKNGSKKQKVSSAAGHIAFWGRAAEAVFGTLPES